jgi:hypothetical protein
MGRSGNRNRSGGGVPIAPVVVACRPHQALDLAAIQQGIADAPSARMARAVRYLGIEVDDALTIAEQVEL